MISRYGNSVDSCEGVPLKAPGRCLLFAFATCLLTACGGNTSGNISGGNPDGSSANTPSLNSETVTGNTDSQTGTPNSVNQILPGGNSPPRVSVPDLLSLTVRSGRSVLATVTDADGDALGISWEIIERPFAGDLEITVSQERTRAFIGANTVAGRYVIAVTVSDGTNVVQTTFPVDVINRPPVVSSITIGPTIPTAAYPLQAIHDRVFDQDIGDQVSLSYTWTINDTIQIQTDLPTLEAGIVNRGDSVQVELRAADYLQNATIASPVVVIKNAPPGGSIGVLPLTANTSDELSISVFDLIDVDGDSIDLSYQWYLNGVRLQNQSASTLPAGIAKFPDVVSARVLFSDGTDSTLSTNFNLRLTDTLSVLDRQTIPETLPLGVAATFPVRYSDPDERQITATLLDAPAGMSYDSATGLASWTPTPFMFNSTEEYRARFASSDGQTDSIELTVVDNNRPPLMARSAIQVPLENTRLDIGDFDSDGRPEILSTDSIQRIFTLEFDGVEIKQDWFYPFGLIDSKTIVALWSHGSDGSQIIVATDSGVNLISSRTKRPRQVYKSNAQVQAAALADINQDGIKELALLTNQQTLVVLRTDNWQPFVPEIPLPGQDSNFFHGVAIGNVDSDSTLEIVVSSGEVIDGITGIVQWQYADGFGSIIAIGDIDGDGNNEILAADPRGDLASYDAYTQTKTRQYDQTDTCSLRLYNADSDPQLEVFNGSCQHEAVEVFDAANGPLVLKQQFNNSDFSTGRKSISLGDIDGDGTTEVVFSAGTSMAVAALAGLGDTTPSGLVFHDNPARTGSFHIAGWSTNAAGEDVAVFTLPNTESTASFSRGHRIGWLSETGELTISNATAKNWGDRSAGAVIDRSANNGVDGVLVAVGDPYDGQLLHLNLDDFSLQHTHEVLVEDSLSRPEIVSMVVDYQDDGSAMAVLATDGEQLQVYDITARQVTWTSEALPIRMVGAITIDADSGFSNTDSGFKIVAATSKELTLWTGSAAGRFTKAYTATAACKYLTEIKLAGETNIACLDVSLRDEIRLKIFNSRLIKLSEVTLDYEATALAATKSGKLFIASIVKSGYSTADHQSRLHLVDPTTGYQEWSSAAMVGVATGIRVLSNTAGELEKLGVSTTRAMYIGSR